MMGLFPAIAIFLLPIAMPPNHRAAPVISSAPVPAEGMASVQQLLADRPDFRRLFRPDDAVGTWLAVHFANDGWPIRWSNRQDVDFHHFAAVHVYDAVGHPTIYVSRRGPHGALLTSEQQLSGLVFELLNAGHQHEFDQVWEAARHGRLKRGGFVLAAARIEFKTCHETMDFHNKIWAPHAWQNHLAPNDGNWHLEVGDSFARWIDYHRNVLHDGYPDDLYGREYAEILSEHAPKEAASPDGK